LCRSALRSILAAELGCRGDEVDFGEEDRGKPFALVRDSPAPISFNVSHSGRHGLIAFARRGRVGVDVEERCDRPYLDSLVDTVLSQDESRGRGSAARPEAARLPSVLDD
jgi:4'-phosphopantetheinyl transferase